MKQLKRLFETVSRFAAPLALGLAVLTANSTCFCLSYQPEEPACLKKMHFRDMQVRK